MTKEYGYRRNRPLHTRPLDEEDDATRYKREGWDPRKTYEENMSGESLFVDDGSLEEPDLEPAPRHRKPSRAVRDLAAEGRGEDTEIAHLTRSEFVVPRALQTPAFMAALERAAAAHGVPLEMLSIGNAMNRINPNTGAPEFGLLSGFGDWVSRTFGMGTANAAEARPEQVPSQQPPYRYEGPEVEGITVTTPAEQGLVQLPQNLAKSGFYNYTPKRDKGPPYANGEAQYGLAATMGVIGEAGDRWRATGRAPFGVGDMSLPDGGKYGGHRTAHQNGTAFDMRPVRRDGKPDRVGINDPAYDREATQRLVDMLRATGGVNQILFNDPQIKGVSPWEGHDDHLHVRTNPSWRRR